MNAHPSSYYSPKLEERPLPEKGGYGAFALEPIAAGELLAVWGGDAMNGASLHKLPPARQSLSVQVDEDLYLVPMAEGPADRVNHSCTPNAGLRGQITLVALRDIEPGEEVCYDYAMTDASPYDEFTCMCGSVHCRRQVTGNDWRDPALWERYAGYFSPYLQRRIDQLREAVVDWETAGI